MYWEPFREVSAVATGVPCPTVSIHRKLRSEDMAEFCVGLFREGELFKYYDHWITHRRESYVLEHEHPGNIRHTHAINKIVAQKPQ